jgi:quinol monooxygenase YgiN
MKPVNHHVIMRAKEGKGPELATLLDWLLDRMSKEACLIYFSILRSATDEDVFMLYESWRDADEYAAIRDGDYRMEYVKRRDVLLREPPEVYRWKEVRVEQRPVSSRSSVGS